MISITAEQIDNLKKNYSDTYATASANYLLNLISEEVLAFPFFPNLQVEGIDLTSLAQGLATHESGLHPLQVKPEYDAKGVLKDFSIGLFQVEINTARDILNDHTSDDSYIVNILLDSRRNVDIGIQYLINCIDYNNDLKVGIGCYNSGIAKPVNNYTYVSDVMNCYDFYLKKNNGYSVLPPMKILFSRQYLASPPALMTGGILIGMSIFLWFKFKKKRR